MHTETMDCPTNEAEDGGKCLDPAETPPVEPSKQLVPAHQGSLELLDARWDLNSGRTARFRIIANGKPLHIHPFAEFVQRRGNRVGSRFRAAFIRVGESDPYFVGEVMLAGGGNPLQAGMWVKFWFDEESTEHPFKGCTSRSNTHPGDLFDAVFIELDDDDGLVDSDQRREVERLASLQHENHALARFAALLGTNELFLQWLSEVILMPDTKVRPVEWWRADDHVARYIRWICQIESRSELDRNLQAARLFHQHIREPYNNWRHTKED